MQEEQRPMPLQSVMLGDCFRPRCLPCSSGSRLTAGPQPSRSDSSHADTISRRAALSSLAGDAGFQARLPTCMRLLCVDRPVQPAYSHHQSLMYWPNPQPPSLSHAHSFHELFTHQQPLRTTEHWSARAKRAFSIALPMPTALVAKSVLVSEGKPRVEVVVEVPPGATAEDARASVGEAVHVGEAVWATVVPPMQRPSTACVHDVAVHGRRRPPAWQGGMRQHSPDAPPPPKRPSHAPLPPA